MVGNAVGCTGHLPGPANCAPGSRSGLGLHVDLLDGGGGILRSRVRHDGGVHAADLPLDEVQVGTGPGVPDS